MVYPCNCHVPMTNLSAEMKKGIIIADLVMPPMILFAELECMLTCQTRNYKMCWYGCTCTGSAVRTLTLYHWKCTEKGAGVWNITQLPGGLLEADD